MTHPTALRVLHTGRCLQALRLQHPSTDSKDPTPKQVSAYLEQADAIVTGSRPPCCGPRTALWQAEEDAPPAKEEEEEDRMHL